MSTALFPNITAQAGYGRQRRAVIGSALRYQRLTDHSEHMIASTEGLTPRLGERAAFALRFEGRTRI